MQKKLIAIAVAAVLVPAAAMADTANVAVYGRLNVSVDHQNDVTGQNSSTFVNTNSSRFGVKGSEDLGGGLSAIFQVETNVNLTGTGRGGNGNTVANSAAANYGAFGGQVRDTFLGLASNDLGKIQFGRLPMENHWVYEYNLFADQIGDLGNFNSPVGGRANGEVLYTTPNMQGITANLQYYPTSSIAPDAAAGSTAGAKNSYGMKLNYNASGLNASFNYLNRSTGLDTEYKPIVVSASYDFGPGSVGGQYMRDKRDAGAASAKRNIYNIGGKLIVGGNGALKAQYSRANDATGTTANGLTVGTSTGARMFAIGYDHNLSKRTTLYVAYANTRNDSGAAFGVGGNGHNNQQPGVAVGNDPKGFGVGMAHNF